MPTLRIPPHFAGQRLDAALAALVPEYSRSRLSAWIRAGLVRVSSGIDSPSARVAGDEIVDWEAEDAQPMPDQAQAIALCVLFEDAHVIVLNKPPDIVVHPGAGNRDGTLLNALLHHAPALASIPRAGIVHRLDKETSGLMVVAKTLESQTALVRQLQERSVKREYLAVVHGVVNVKGTVDGDIDRDPRHRTRMSVVAHGKPARTHYTPVQRFDKHTLLRCALETGRTHQIRVHLAHIGHPLVGDPVYGKRNDILFHRQALHATQLAFIHPTLQKTVQFEASMPSEITELLAKL